jgi:hypothetical protein
MIKPEQIPDEVIHAACEEYGGGHLVDMKHAIAAAINAWPGAWGECDFAGEWISLPLPEEKNDV